MAEIEWAGQRLVLLPQRAAWLPDRRCLLVADMHLGKAASFRRLGVPVPEATTDGTLSRLSAALAATDATRVIFLGDLLHSAHVHDSATVDAVQAWRDRHAGLELLLVRGNHERHAGDPPPGWRVAAVDEPLSIGMLAVKHHPRPEPDAWVVAGHLHPCTWVGGRAPGRLRLPCFHFGARLAVLPAFGEFTGMHAVSRSPGDRLFVVAADQVREWPVPPQFDACAPDSTR